MHKQYVNYSANMPVSISYETIKNYPIHWHYCIEILYVIKGTINLYINTEKYVINENQVEIINLDEVHSIESDDPDNKVIIFQIDPYFFQKYYRTTFSFPLIKSLIICQLLLEEKLFN